MKDCGTRSFEMWSKSSAEAVETQCWAKSPQVSHVRIHSATKTGSHASHWARHACVVPLCHFEHKGHSTLHRSQGGEHPDQRTLPHTHCIHMWRRTPRRGSHLWIQWVWG